MSLGADGEAFSNVDVSLPAPAWMIPLVPDESTQPCLRYHIETIEGSWNGKKIYVEHGVLVASTLSDPNVGSLSIVKVINGTKFAMLNRGLLYLGIGEIHQPSCLFVYSIFE